MTADRPDLEALRRLSDAATEGPWRAYGDHLRGEGDALRWVVQGNGTRTTADAAFIAAAVNYVRALLADGAAAEDEGLRARLVKAEGERQMLADALRDSMADLARTQDDAQAARRMLADERAAVAEYERLAAQPEQRDGLRARISDEVGKSLNPPTTLNGYERLVWMDGWNAAMDVIHAALAAQPDPAPLPDREWKV